MKVGGYEVLGQIRGLLLAASNGDEFFRVLTTEGALYAFSLGTIKALVARVQAAVTTVHAKV
jgi:hypothetical protein